MLDKIGNRRERQVRPWRGRDRRVVRACPAHCSRDVLKPKIKKIKNLQVHSNVPIHVSTYWTVGYSLAWARLKTALICPDVYDVAEVGSLRFFAGSPL